MIPEKPGRKAPRIRVGNRRSIPSPIDQALEVVRKNFGHSPSNEEQEQCKAEIIDLVARFQEKKLYFGTPVSPSEAKTELEEICFHAKKLESRLNQLSPFPFFLMRIAAATPDLSAVHKEVASEILGPGGKSGALAQRMRALHELAEIAVKDFTKVPEGTKTIDEAVMGSEVTEMMCDCCRVMGKLTGRIDGLGVFARAVRRVAFPDAPKNPRWGELQLKFVKSWWEKLAPHYSAIEAAAIRFEHDAPQGTQDLIGWIAQETCLPTETVMLYLGPLEAT